MSTTFERRQHLRAELDRVRDRLIAEFAYVLPSGTVARHVGQAREQLATAGVRTGRPVTVEVVEAAARQRLSALQESPGPQR